MASIIRAKVKSIFFHTEFDKGFCVAIGAVVVWSNSLFGVCIFIYKELA